MFLSMSFGARMHAFLLAINRRVDLLGRVGFIGMQLVQLHGALCSQKLGTWFSGLLFRSKIPFLYGSIFDLQYCVSFTCTAK